jgi:hypothetical protein
VAPVVFCAWHYAAAPGPASYPCGSLAATLVRDQALVSGGCRVRRRTSDETGARGVVMVVRRGSWQTRGVRHQAALKKGSMNDTATDAYRTPLWQGL